MFSPRKCLIARRIMNCWLWNFACMSGTIMPILCNICGGDLVIQLNKTMFKNWFLNLKMYPYKTALCMPVIPFFDMDSAEVSGWHCGLQKACQYRCPNTVRNVFWQPTFTVPNSAVVLCMASFKGFSVQVFFFFFLTTYVLPNLDHNHLTTVLHTSCEKTFFFFF